MLFLHSMSNVEQGHQGKGSIFLVLRLGDRLGMLNGPDFFITLDLAKGY